ncbi:MAG: class I SAM-dependent methyltransferase [Pseudomonadota bacterium]
MRPITAARPAGATNPMTDPIQTSADAAVAAQYEVYPYPARDPKEETKRLIAGSPSNPVEIDHFLYAGTRDWTQPFRALIAGGGTGDALIQLAQMLTTAKAPYEITYLDPSVAARDIAEARAKARKLTGLRFITGSLMDAADHGPFDYVDCCGVLHHLDDPVAGLKALKAALTPTGGLGYMVYAPYGRSGVYPLQNALSQLLSGLPPEERLAVAKQILPKVPEGHPFRRNPHLGDHLGSDAGLYDLLLHSRDRAFTIREWLDALGEAGFDNISMTAPALYDLSMVTPVPDGMDTVTQMELAEQLRGTIRKHTGYAAVAGKPRPPASAVSLAMVPHLDGPRAKIAEAVAKGAKLALTAQGTTFSLRLPKAAAPILNKVNGRRSLSDIAQQVHIDAIRFAEVWGHIDRAMTATGNLRYSRLLRPGKG